MLNNKMAEYNGLSREIQKLKSQMPSMEEVVASDDAAETQRKISNKINDLKRERSISREWLSGYMSACADMKNTKIESKIATLLGE